MALLLASSPASAATITNDRPLLFSVDARDGVASFSRPEGGLAVDYSTEELYAIDVAGEGKGPTGYGSQPGEWDDERVVCKFDAGGKPQDFTAGESAGTPCLDGKETPGGAFGVLGFFEPGAQTTDVAVDNSEGNGGPGEGEQGRLYVSEATGPIHAFSPDGTWLWTLPSSAGDPCGIAVDTAGFLWIVDQGQKRALKFDTVGAGPPSTVPLEEVTLTASAIPCRPAIDQSGKVLYVADRNFVAYLGVHKYVRTEPGKWVFDSTLTNETIQELEIDQSGPSGHILGIDNDDGDINPFAEYEPCAIPKCAGKAVSGSPFGRDLIGDGRGIAYNPALDRVYVTDLASNSIKAFGPITSGTAPDVNCQAADPVGLHSFTARCTINPLGLPNSYRFEWKEGAGPGWGAAESSPPQTISPTDSAPHAVSLAISEYKGKALRSNTQYQVRLAGINTEPGQHLLTSYAAPDSPKTLVPPSATVEGCAVSEIETESAVLTCVVDPQEEETEWRVLLAPLPGATTAKCEALEDSEFEDVTQGSIPGEEPGTVEIGADLEGLLPAQAYCVRAAATNPGGDGSDDVSFATAAVPPSEAEAAFAAPRTDTEARINGRINPNGEADLEYRFEWSEDGANWNLLPVRTSTIDARGQIVVADELTGLEPGTTYRFRFGLVSNGAGPAAVLGGEKAFTTRTSLEAGEADPPSCPNEDVRAAQGTTYLGVCRGVELVNNPDKGNQIVYATPPTGGGVSPMSTEGDKVLWYALSGVPGGTSGTQSTFLAEREGDKGWSSSSLAPPAEQQFGKGEFVYSLIASSSDIGEFLFEAKLSTGLALPPPPRALARVRADGQHDVLTQSEEQTDYSGGVDLSEDGEHILAINPATGQLEDVGGASIGPPAVPGEVVSVMPDGGPSECGLNPIEGNFGANGSPMWKPGYRWIAGADASRVYFRATPNASEPGGGSCGSAPVGLYVRIREGGKAETTQIDAGFATKSPGFLRATPDGRHAYFTTGSKLAFSDTNSGIDIYRWEEESGESSCLTCAFGGGGGAQLNVIGPQGDLGVAISNDFSHVYFISLAQLVEGRGEPGMRNLYVLEDDEVHFIATVDEDVLYQTERPALSGDGEMLLFRTQADPRLTADPMASECLRRGSSGKATLGACKQLFLYEDGEESLECLSCKHDGVTTHSFGTPTGNEGGDAVLAEDGRTAALATQEALVAEDVNQETDVYEWRAGRPNLVTDGVTDFQVGLSAPQVLAIDADGSDILFGVVPPGGRLTGFERDRVLNLYDARTGGGFHPPPPLEPCSGDACQGPLPPASAPQRPASADFAGPGNPKPKLKKRPCARKRGKAKRRCIAKQRRRAANARHRGAK